PVIVKAGFYLGKLSSAAAPEQFGSNFNLIWAFGLGISGGVGKEIEEGPFKAGASLVLGLTVQGFLASFDGTLTDDGIDYYWWGISLSLTGKIFGAVDFKIIKIDVSLTVVITVAFALETQHSSSLALTAQVKVNASVKIGFIKISYSFDATLDVFSTTFGSGPPAQLSGPTPQMILVTADQPPDRLLDAELLAETGRRFAESPPPPLDYRAPGPPFARPAADPVDIEIRYVMQPTSVSADGSAWAPQGVATLVLKTGDTTSPFGRLCAGLAGWLIDRYGTGDDFHQQLAATRAALARGDFDDQVSTALAETFTFAIKPNTFESDTEVVSLAMHPSLGLQYPLGDDARRDSFGSRRLPANYADMAAAYFAGTAVPQAAPALASSVAEQVFDGYFVGLAQQLVQLLINTGAPDLGSALGALSLGDLGGYVSRFLNGGARLPDPDNMERLEALYILTGQQFALQKDDDEYRLDSALIATDSTPSWIEVTDPTTSRLEPSMVHTDGPTAPPWTVSPLPALVAKPRVFPMNTNVGWMAPDTTSYVINTLSDDVRQAIRDWRDDNPNGPFLALDLIGGGGQRIQQADLATPGRPWTATAALALPIQLAAIPNPDDAGGMLPDVFSLLGTDEANRALLQNLLADPAIDIRSLDLLASSSRGNFVSTETPKVLVRTDLATDNAPTGFADLDPGNGFCANYAKPALGGDELAKFLRLVWEVSVVHSSGFYLQVKNLDPDMFADGPADLILLVQFGEVGAIVEATAYQNALVGEAPADGMAIFATLASDAQGTVVPGYTAAYPGGEVGWSVTWNDAPAEADAGSDGFLQGLYQTVSYKVTQIDDEPVDQNWSRPVNAQDETADGDANTTWNYQRAFETATLIDADNRYAAVGRTASVEISIEDVFGNTVPSSLRPKVELPIVYNDEILGLGDWAGSQVYYQIAGADPVQLTFLLSLDPAVIRDEDGNVDPGQLERATALYAQILDQLTDPNLSAGADSGGILAEGLLDTLADGTTLVAGLAGFVRPIVSWLRDGATGEPPPPAALAMTLDRAYPTRWPGDLQELAVGISLRRTGVRDEIAAKSPQVRQVDAPVQPVQDTGAQDDPSGLTTFANHLETAYFPFDGDSGVIKVATGTNADVTSQQFGRRSIWLQRWSEDAGTAVEVLNDADHPPVFFTPPPLSTQLITREVEGLRKYQDSPHEYEEVDQVFASTDMDLLAADFLATVERVFQPVLAPAVADHSTAEQELYDPFVAHKTSLAGSISESVDYVYDYPGEPPGDLPSATKTWRQALLRTLENDYGFSTLTQLEALVRLHGQIEPGGDPDNPPRLYGAVQTPERPEDGKPPYTLMPATLPLVEGRNWLNCLVSAQDPERNRAFNLDLDYQVNQLEHLRDGAAVACGYTPSSWLTFVLQQNPEQLPQGRDNTLTQPIGETRIPIPLRSYPPLPKLLLAQAHQKETIGGIEDALAWTLQLAVERSTADQDSLDLSISFNQPQPLLDVVAPEAALHTGRPPAADLFAALARFAFEYPQLEEYIDKLPGTGDPDAVQAVKELSHLFAGAARTWPEWQPPQAALGGFDQADHDSDREVWRFEIEDVEGSVDLQVIGIWSRGDTPPDFPQIAGYTRVSKDGNTAIYQPIEGRLAVLDMSWPGLPVLAYQNALPSVFTERNRNLAVPPVKTNPAFVYRTETVTWPTPIVPLVRVADLLTLDHGPSLEAAVRAMLEQLTETPPTGGTDPELSFETSIDYRYQVLEHEGRVSSQLPVFLLDETLRRGGEETVAEAIAGALSDWRNNTQAQAHKSSLRFQLTVFATTIVSDDDRLPLIQFAGLVIPVPTDNPDWW
ncbi:MAG: hypothetical protein AAF560_18560, partial [Acidobacteriota bacterium]